LMQREGAGGFQAGKKLTELCLAELEGAAGLQTYGDVTFPSITVSSDFPAIAMLGSQFAGWRIKEPDGNIAIGSGPSPRVGRSSLKMFLRNRLQRCKRQSSAYFGN